MRARVKPAFFVVLFLVHVRDNNIIKSLRLEKYVYMPKKRVALINAGALSWGLLPSFFFLLPLSALSAYYRRGSSS